MHSCNILLALTVSSSLPWLIAAISSAGLLTFIFLYIKQRISLNKNLPLTSSSIKGKADLLTTLMDSMPDWIYIKDRESKFIMANKHVARSHGIKDPARMTGKTDYDFYPEALAKTFFEDEQEIMKNGEPLINHEEKLIDPSGEEIFLSTTKIPFNDRAGKALGIVGIGRNVTCQNEDQQRLKELSMVASGTENVVIIMDKEGNFKWANRGFETRYGCSLDEFITKHGGNLRKNSSKEQINEIIDEVLKKGKPYTYTSRTQDPSSNDAWYQTNITPILNEEGELSSMFLIDSDITAIKKADLQIKQQKYELESQRDQLKKLNASKDRLFSIIAHDLKNPFQSIIGFSELLKEDFRTMKMNQVEDYLECIYDSSTSAYNLLNNLLEWVRSQTRSIEVKPVHIGIKELSTEILNLFSVQAKNKEIQLRNRLHNDLTVVADYHMLNTIIRNLIANALKYTEPGGNITISGSVNHAMMEINVNDTGVGMEEEKIKTLFSLEKGKSTPGTSGELGTGLGLLVSYEFLQLIKGTFQVKSKLGEGSTFTISLPLETE